MNEHLLELLQNKEYRRLKEQLNEMNDVDIASFIEEAPPDKIVLIFRMLTKDNATEVFANLSNEMQRRIVESISDKEIATIIEDLYIDDAVDFLEEMPAGIVKKVLSTATEDTRALINSLLQYPENSAGSIMTIEYVDLDEDMTVEDAFKRIRRTGVDKETIYTCYVTDESRRLIGTISVKTLLLSNFDDMISELMETHIVSAQTMEDQEAVAHLFKKYDLLSIPVVDRENRLIGIITVDDVFDVIQEEATEDFEKMAAMLPSEKPYLKTGVFALAKNRLLWLLVLMFSAMVTGGILTGFEEAISAIPLLVSFIPMLTDTGGNAGSQSSTLVIRGMALQEIKLKDALKVWWKELRVSLLVGTGLAVINFIRVSIQYNNNPVKTEIAITVGISMFLTVIIAKTVGGLLPMFAKLCRADPAIMAAPLVTTIVDAFSLMIFFSIAKMLMHL